MLCQLNQYVCVLCFLVNIGSGWNKLAVPGDLKYHSELQCDFELNKSPKTISIEIVQKTHLAGGPAIQPISIFGWFMTASKPIICLSQSFSSTSPVLLSSPAWRNWYPSVKNIKLFYLVISATARETGVLACSHRQAQLPIAMEYYC